MNKRKQLAAAIDVRWTPEIAARVKTRLGDALAARRRRRRRATLLVTIVAVGAGGFALAWVGRGRGPERRDVAPAARPPGQASSEPAALPAPAPPAAVLAGAPPAEGPTPALPRPARARRFGAAPATDVVGDLLAAADAARLAGRPRDAVGPLSEIATRHASDPRAAIAAFQLGRVLADDLHDPAGAARAFARVYELDPDGPLARDARTRAAEARRAGTSR